MEGVKGKGERGGGERGVDGSPPSSKVRAT